MVKCRHQVMWMWNKGENDDGGKSGIAGKKKICSKSNLLFDAWLKEIYYTKIE